MEFIWYEKLHCFVILALAPPSAISGTASGGQPKSGLPTAAIFVRARPVFAALHSRANQPAKSGSHSRVQYLGEKHRSRTRIGKPATFCQIRGLYA